MYGVLWGNPIPTEQKFAINTSGLAAIDQIDISYNQTDGFNPNVLTSPRLVCGLSNSNYTLSTIKIFSYSENSYFTDDLQKEARAVFYYLNNGQMKAISSILDLPDDYKIEWYYYDKNQKEYNSKKAYVPQFWVKIDGSADFIQQRICDLSVDTDGLLCCIKRIDLSNSLNKPLEVYYDFLLFTNEDYNMTISAAAEEEKGMDYYG